VVVEEDDRPVEAGGAEVVVDEDHRDPGVVVPLQRGACPPRVDRDQDQRVDPLVEVAIEHPELLGGVSVRIGELTLDVRVRLQGGLDVTPHALAPQEALEDVKHHHDPGGAGGAHLASS
jgi:hypothetical protein